MCYLTHELLQLATIINGEADILLTCSDDPLTKERRLHLIKIAAKRISELTTHDEQAHAALVPEHAE